MKQLSLAFLVVLAFFVVLVFAVPRDASANRTSENDKSPLGANLNFMAAWSSEYTFVDAFKQSSPWLAIDTSTWTTVNEDQLTLDDAGWPISLRNRYNSNVVYGYIGTVMFDSLEGHYPVGQYTVTFEGDGEIEYTRDAVMLSESRVGNVTTQIIDVDPVRGGNGIMLKIVATDTNNDGNYVRNIRVIAPGFSADTQQIFHPDFLEGVSKFKVLRYMDWMRTNWMWSGAGPIREAAAIDTLTSHPLHDAIVDPYAVQVTEEQMRSNEMRDWADRSHGDDARYTTDDGVPIEIMVALANEVDANPWVNMPHMATDDYVEGFANYMRTNLDPEQIIYVEYSNEVWNSGFYQARWVEERGKEEWPDSTVSDLEKRLSYFGKRSAEICDIWEDVFALVNPDRVRCMIATQGANPWLGEKMLDCPLWEEAPCYDHNVDMVAIAPYFGQHIGALQHRDDLQTWLNDPDGGLSKVFNELAYGSELPDEQWLTRVTIAQAEANVTAYAAVAEARGIDLVAYEGGQHLVTVGYPQANDSDKAINAEISELFMEANRDPRMRYLYLDYYDHWLETASDIHVLYSSVGTFSQWGSWGSQEYMDEPDMPKRQAADNFIALRECPWLSCEPVGGNQSQTAPTAISLDAVGVDSAEIPKGLLIMALMVGLVATSFVKRNDDI